MNLAIRWNQIIRDPFFRDVPYKVELKNNGQILMSPASNWHGYAQGELAAQLRKKKKNGKVITECSILTRDGVRVADVAWASDEFIHKNGFKTPYLTAPEICIEVISPGNSSEEISGKVGLYLEKGALEVWTVNDRGVITVYDHVGPSKLSKLAKGIKLK